MYLLVAVVGALGVLNLLLTLAVIRRLREHTEALAKAETRPVKFREIPLTIAPGTPVGEFTTVTTTGRVFTAEDLPADAIIGFFSMYCETCIAKVPSFVEYVKRMPSGSSRALAVVVGSPEKAAPVVARLEPAAQVMVELPDGPVATALAVTGFPTFILLDRERTLVSSTMELFELPDPALA